MGVGMRVVEGLNLGVWSMVVANYAYMHIDAFRKLVMGGVKE